MTPQPPTRSAIPGAKSDARAATIAKNSIWMGLDNAFGLAGGFIASILVARKFGPVQLGYYSYVMWFIMLTSALAGRVGLANTTRKYMSEYLGHNQPARARRVLRALNRLQLALGIMCVLLALAFILPAVPAEDRLFAILGSLCVLPSLGLAVATGANMSLEDFASNVKASALGNVVNISGVFLTLLLNGTLAGLAAALLAGRIVDSGLRQILCRRNYKPLFAGITAADEAASRLDIREKKRIVVFTLQSVVIQILNMVVWDRSELLVLKYFSPIQQVAFYSVSFSIIQQTATLYRAFASAAGMSMMRRHVLDPEGAKRMASTMLRHLALVAFPITMGLAVISRPFMTVLYGQRYLEAIPVLFVVGLLGAARALLMPVEQYVLAAERQDLLIRGTLITSVVDLLLAFALIPGWGAIGAAVCNGTSQTLGMVICWMLLRRVVPVEIPWSPIFRTLAASLAMMAVVAPAALYLPPLVALVVGTVAGALAYLVMLRVFACLDREDRRRLGSLGSKLPGRLRPHFDRVLDLLTA